MNKAETVPIATLSGIASLTEIAPELPLPSSTCVSRDVELFHSQDDATEAIKSLASLTHSQEQILSFEKLLTSVNNAYLDFKSPAHNRPCIFTDIPQLPPIIQCVTKNRPDVFQPHFDSYHGSPLKTNNVSALAYSPDQRNTFIMHQQQQQLEQKQQRSCAPSLQLSPHSLRKDENSNKHERENEAVTSPSPICNSDLGVLHQRAAEFQSNDMDICQHDNNSKQVIPNGQVADELEICKLSSPGTGKNKMDDGEFRLHKKRKKKHKQKRKKGSNKDENSEVMVKEANEHNAQKLTLKIQKLIVRKTTDNRVEVHEVSMTSKHPNTHVNNYKQEVTPDVVQEANEVGTAESENEFSKGKLNGEAGNISSNTTNTVDASLCCGDAQKRFRNMTSLSSDEEEETLEQVQKRKRGISSPTNKVDSGYGGQMGVDSSCNRRSNKTCTETEASDDVVTNDEAEKKQGSVTCVEEEKFCDVAVRERRKKTVNYKEDKSGSEPELSDAAENCIRTKKKKKKRKNKRRGSHSSDEDFDPTDDKLSKRRSQTQVKSPSPDERDKADWNAPALDSYWDEESDEDAEMVNLNKEIAAEGTTEAKRFLFLAEKLFEHELEVEADGNVEMNDDSEIPPELLISRPLISTLCTETAKMKSSGTLAEMPADQLVKVIGIMDRQVKDSLNFVPTRDEPDGKESVQWYNLQIERVVRSAESAAVILLITTSPDMPKQVFLEEAIERVVLLCQFQLENTIFPAFDPIYTVAGDGDCITKKSRKNNRSGVTRSKQIRKVYNKFCEVVSMLSTLLCQGTLTDSIILKMSQIGISPFFVEHVSILQLESLKVSRAIFRTYVKHRDLILEDILSSLSRLPSSKRNLRTYRLHGNEFIQMFTALVLQLIQCTVEIPSWKGESSVQQENDVDKDIIVVKSYEDALRAGRNFLSVFLKKCSSKNDESDYRPLFENFLHDLFTIANLPEWPAAEVLLTQLGHLFVVTFSNSKLEMNLRTIALDYLSQICSHLRKATLRTARDGMKEKLASIVEMLISKDTDEVVVVNDDIKMYDDKLRKALLQFLLSSGDSDPSFIYSREFYLGQWIRDLQMEIEKSILAPMSSIPGAAGKGNQDINEDEKMAKDNAAKLQLLEEKKTFFHALIDDTTVTTLRSAHNLNYDSACITIDHLASSRSFSLSFDVYMQQIFKMLNEQAIALRTKAVKALTLIVSVDPDILAREDVQASVHGRLLDPSTNVREAAVDLIGQFVLKCPNLIKQYYEMIIARILDTGVSVRKRVIKILRDICIEHPEFEKIPEICAKMIRRIEDETGIKKLVTEVFREMWFQPIKSKVGDELYHKAVNITKVISMCKETGFDWLESLLKSLFDTTENQSSCGVALTACQQIVDCLVTRLLKHEVKCETNTIVSCLITLNLFCKAQPSLLIHHATTLQPYLSSKIETPTDSLVIQHVSKILEIVVPLMEHPSPKFLADLEEDSMKLMLKQSQNVVQSCASCLAAIINNVTFNYKFVVDGFTHFHKFLVYYKGLHLKDPLSNDLTTKRSTLLRALFTIGLFCRHFDLDEHVPDDVDLFEKKKKEEVSRSEQIFDLCMYYTDFADEKVALKAILAIGFIGVRYPQLLLKDECRNLYQEILSPYSPSTNAKFTILKSLQNHLIEEENRLQQGEKNLGMKGKRKKNEENHKEDIKEMGDTLSGTTSEIIQVLLKDIMKGFFHTEKQVRISALQVIAIILRQGLIHPAQCIPYLVAISTDTERLCQVKAEQCLNDLDSRYQGFIHMKAYEGVKMSYDIQFVIQKGDGGYVCAYRENENKIALINHVYGLIRSNKQYRRPFLLSVLKQTDDSRTSTDFKYYLIENLAYIGYHTHEEPLFVLYHIDKKASVSGANILQKFKELFRPPSKKENGNSNNSSSDDSSDDDAPLIECSANKEELEKLVKHSFGCILMLELKKYLKTIYGFTDSKCQKYSPLEPSKMYERPLNRKCDSTFKSEFKDFMFSNLEYSGALQYYCKFKKAMMELDKEQDDSDTDLDTDEKTEKRRKGKPSEDADCTRGKTTANCINETHNDEKVKDYSSSTRRSKSRDSEAQKTGICTPTSRSSKKLGNSKNEAINVTPSFDWSFELKIQLIELARNCKLTSARSWLTCLKKRWDEEVPHCKWMTPDFLREHVEIFEDEEVIPKEGGGRRASRRNAR